MTASLSADPLPRRLGLLRALLARAFARPALPPRQIDIENALLRALGGV